MLDKLINKLAAAVVDRLVERLPEITHTIADRLQEELPDFSQLDEQVGAALADLPNLPERIVRELLKNLPFGLGGRL